MNILSIILKFIGEKLKTNDDDINTLKTTSSEHGNEISEHTSAISTLQENQFSLRKLIRDNSTNIKTLDTKIDNVSLNGLPYFSLNESFSFNSYCACAYTTDSKKSIVFTVTLPKLPPTNWSKVCISDFKVVVRQNKYVYGSGWNSSANTPTYSPLFNECSFDGSKNDLYDFYEAGHQLLFHGYCNKTGDKIKINGLTMTISAFVNDTASSYLTDVVNNDVCALNLSIGYIWFE